VPIVDEQEAQRAHHDDGEREKAEECSNARMKRNTERQYGLSKGGVAKRAKASISSMTSVPQVSSRVEAMSR
jgi:hypothetical protein